MKKTQFLFNLLIIFSIKSKYCENAKNEESKIKCIDRFSKIFFDTAWENFLEMFEKKYTNLEKEKRYIVFVKNYKKILLHNIQNRKYQQKVNFFTDLKDEEFERKYLSKMNPKNMRKIIHKNEIKIEKKDLEINNKNDLIIIKKDNKKINETKKENLPKKENKILINQYDKKKIIKKMPLLKKEKKENFISKIFPKEIIKVKNNLKRKIIAKGTGFYSLLKNLQDRLRK